MMKEMVIGFVFLIPFLRKIEYLQDYVYPK